MIKEIRFLPTGEVKHPKTGEWFLGERNRPICASQNFVTSKFQILKMVVIEDDGGNCNTMKA
ncbi:MAG: hypothetical protein C0392_06525 [Syntrophus sp. (in: bacteria)]|nr:hypothetical protein [Syntrophus sp. (in: bacteria)]